MRIIEKGVYTNTYDLQNCKSDEEFSQLFRSKVDECYEAVATFTSIFDTLGFNKKYLDVFSDATNYVSGKVDAFLLEPDFKKRSRIELELMSDYVDLAFSYMMTYLYDMNQKSYYTDKSKSHPYNTTKLAYKDKNEEIISHCEQIILSLEESIAAGEKKCYNEFVTFIDELNFALADFENAVASSKYSDEHISNLRKDLETLLTKISLEIIELKKPQLLDDYPMKNTSLKKSELN